MSTWGCGVCGTRYAVGAPRCPQCSANQPVTAPPSSPLASLTVACLPGDSGCRYGGVTRRVMLPQIVPGVIDMPDLRCAGCGRHMASTTTEGAEDMPKITVHGGASNAADETTEEESSPGTSSSTSPEKEPTSPGTSGSEAPSPARTTASRSKKARTASSAAGTAGGPTAPTSDNDEG